MKTVIVGAGAIGAYVGARLARAGADVTLFARGPHLAAMQQRGVRVLSATDPFEVKPKVSGDLASIGPADVVILGLKAHSLTAVAPSLPQLFGPDTIVVSTQNGVPWWYAPLERVDPGGVIAKAIEARRVLGSIVYFSTEVVEPGVIQHHEGNRMSLGEPEGGRSDRCRQVAEALIAAGLRCPMSNRLREEIWVKVMGSVALNPISALTRATLVQMIRDPDTCALIRGVMTEAEAVAEKLGMKLPISIEQRLAGAEKVGEHKTSMLQDLEAGRPLELEAIVGAVLELGEKLGVPMPQTQAVYACAKLLAASGK